jgi:hypothetical protein
MSQENEALMSVTSLGMPNPSQQGEDLDYDKFIEGLTPEQSKSLAMELAQLYKSKKAQA